VNLVGVTEGYQTIRRLLVFARALSRCRGYGDAQPSLLDHHATRERIFWARESDREIDAHGRLTLRYRRVRERVETFGPFGYSGKHGHPPLHAHEVLHRMEVVASVDVQAARVEDVPSVERQVGRLPEKQASGEAEYKVLTLTAIPDAAKKYLAGLTIVLIIIAFIALVISGIGIMNMMLVTVTERTREIGNPQGDGAARPGDHVPVLDRSRSK